MKETEKKCCEECEDHPNKILPCTGKCRCHKISQPAKEEYKVDWGKMLNGEKQTLKINGKTVEVDWKKRTWKIVEGKEETFDWEDEFDQACFCREELLEKIVTSDCLYSKTDIKDFIRKTLQTSYEKGKGDKMLENVKLNHSAGIKIGYDKGVEEERARIKKIFQDILEDHCGAWHSEKECKKNHKVFMYCGYEMEHGIELEKVIELLPSLTKDEK